MGNLNDTNTLLRLILLVLIGAAIVFGGTVMVGNGKEQSAQNQNSADCINGVPDPAGSGEIVYPCD